MVDRFETGTPTSFKISLAKSGTIRKHANSIDVVRSSLSESGKLGISLAGLGSYSRLLFIITPPLKSNH